MIPEHSAWPSLPFWIVLPLAGFILMFLLLRTSIGMRWKQSGGEQALHEIQKLARKGAILVGGTSVILAGIAMLVLPGPGIATIILGLFILATEFLWAKRLLDKAKKRLGDAYEQVKNGLNKRKVPDRTKDDDTGRSPRQS